MKSTIKFSIKAKSLYLDKERWEEMELFRKEKIAELNKTIFNALRPNN